MSSQPQSLESIPARCARPTHRAYALFAIAALALARTASAQIAPCDDTLHPGFVASDENSLLYFYGFSPSVPAATTPIRIDTGRIAFNPASVSTELHGQEIDIVVIGALNDVGIPPPLQCISTTLEPLAAGTYTVVAEFRDPDSSSDDFAPPATLTVAGGGVDAAAPLPASSTGFALLLAGLTAMLGLMTARSRRARD